jgi:signal transduction histidine kinase
MLSQQGLLIPDTQEYPGWTTLITRKAVGSWLGIPLIAGNKTIGVLALQKAEPNSFNTSHIGLTEAVSAQAAVAIQNAWLFEQVRAGHERLQSLSRRLVEIQESERRYIARELHDEASQSLTALKFGLRLLEQDVHQPENLLSRLAELKNLTDGVLEELHRLAMGLRPASLDYLGLVAALEQLVKDNDQRYKMTIRFRATGFTGERRLPDYVETTIYRIVQEALTNAVRHANAKNLDVILEQRKEKTVIIVEDDGIGFDTRTIGTSGHLGMMGMQERAQMIGAALTIESEHGCGTIIVMEVPYDN